MRSKAKPFLLKSGALLLGLLCLTYLPYLIMGLVSRITGRIYSLHLTYPVEPRFIAPYAFQNAVMKPVYRMVAWSPSPIGRFRQGAETGLFLGVTADEVTLLTAGNTAKLSHLCRRLRRIQWLTGAKKVSLAGVLPSYIARNQIDTKGLKIDDPRPATRQALLSAIDQTIAAEFTGAQPQIVLFGGAGYVGSDLACALEDRGHTPRIIDKKGPGETAQSCLAELQGRDVLMVDVARRQALDPHIPALWPGVVLLNETYPEPTGASLAALHDQGVIVRHVAGVEGRLQPPLPGGYGGAVPCCAAHRIGPDTRAVVKPL